MSIMIATPAFGGQVRMEYMQACLKLQESFQQVGMEYSWLMTGNESLITRGRDTSAAQFLKQKDFTHLMFIDADIVFEPEDVAALWNLEVPVACAAYPMKKPDAPLAAWKDGRLLTLEDKKAFDGPTAVDYAGTGFLLIQREVFEALQDAHPEYAYEEGIVGECWGFFQDPITGAPGKRVHLSEDYFFCQSWRDLGGEIILDPSIRLGHIGSFEYR